MEPSFKPVLLSLIAGLATGGGGLLVLSLRKIGDRTIDFLMGFASGVMLLVAFHRLFLEAAKLLTHFELILMFSLGGLIMIALDLFLPHIELTRRKDNDHRTRILNTVMLIAIGIAIHNCPEGLVVTAGYAYMPKLGLIIAISILLHNIPECIATAMPLRTAGMSASKAAGITFLSGLAEPVGALIGVAAFSILTTNSVVLGSSLDHYGNSV